MRTTPRRTPAVRTVPLRRAAALALGALVPIGAVAVVASGAASPHAQSAKMFTSVETAKFGRVLASGHTVYTLRPNGHPCTATCLKYWPEVLLPAGVTHATAGPGVKASKLGTIKRGSRLQVTYAGRPLYWFVLDTANGQAKGNVTDTWGRWSVVVLAANSSTTTTTTAASTSTTGAPVTTTTKVPPPTTVPSGGGGGGGAGF